LLLQASQLDTQFLSLSAEIDLDVMTSFATHYRYPNEEEEEFPTQEELNQARRFCEKAKALVEAKITEGGASSAGDPPRKRGHNET
jgi:hypothetical protein